MTGPLAGCRHRDRVAARSTTRDAAAGRWSSTRCPSFPTSLSFRAWPVGADRSDGQLRSWSTFRSSGRAARGGVASVPDATCAGPGPLLAEDLDAVEDRLQGYDGPAKLQMLRAAHAGGRSRAAGRQRRRSATRRRVARSRGQPRRGTEWRTSRDLRRRVPGAEWVVQVDEPALSAVTAGSIPRPSGWGTIAAVSPRMPAGCCAASSSQFSEDGCCRRRALLRHRARLGSSDRRCRTLNTVPSASISR